MAGRLLESFFQIATTINDKSLRPDQQLASVLHLVLSYLEVEHGSIMLLENKHLVVRAASRPSLLGFRQSTDEESVAAWVARNKEPLFIPDIDKDARFSSRGAGYKKNALLSLPLMNCGRLVGVINVTDRAGKQDLLQDDIAYLADFSGLIISMIEQQLLYSKVKRQKETLRKRNAELRRQERMRADLTNMLVHDLKGPLSEVVANLDILSYTIDEPNREFLEAAQIGCERAVRMAANLVDIGKIEDGKLRLLKEIVAPRSLLDESISAVKGLGRIKGVQIEMLPLAEDIPHLQLDRILILRVLQNLLTNALGVSPPKSVIQVGCVLLEATRRMEFSVTDQGPGVLPEHRTLIFEKYARLTSRADLLQSTGLGLYYCKLAVEAHRGSISVGEGRNGGSRFFFQLPC